MLVTGIANTFRADTDMLASLGIHWYQLILDVEYITPFGPGANTLPPFYKMHADPHEPGAPSPFIVDQATIP